MILLFVQRYLNNIKSETHPHYYQIKKYSLEHKIVPFFKDKYLEEITPTEIERYRSLRLEKTKPATVNRDLAYLKHLYNKAIDWEVVVFNPVKKVKMLRESPGRVRYLSPEEIERLLARCPDTIAPVVIIALNTGLRRGEIFNLKWRDIDFKNRLLTIVKGKNNEASVIPINKRVYQALSKMSKNEEYIFSDLSVRSLQRLFKKSVKQAEIKEFRFHDLRHTFASYLWIGGENLPVIQKLMRHKSVSMTMRYSHLSRKYLEQAVENIYKGLPCSEEYKTGHNKYK